MDFYTLKALAAKEEVTYDFLRQLMVKISNGKEPIWRGYKFIRPGKKYWLAYPADQEVRFHDAP
jgi:hypothetical protein